MLIKYFPLIVCTRIKEFSGHMPFSYRFYIVEGPTAGARKRGAKRPECDECDEGTDLNVLAL